MAELLKEGKKFVFILCHTSKPIDVNLLFQ